MQRKLIHYLHKQEKKDTGHLRAVILGLGRIVALCHRSSNSYQISEHIRCLYSVF